MKKTLRKSKLFFTEKYAYFYKKFRMFLSEQLSTDLDPATTSEQAIIDSFRSKVTSFVIPEDSTLPTDADRMWNRFKKGMRDYVLNNDPRTFLRCRSIIKSISVPDSPYGKKELTFLKGLPDWSSKWRPAIEEDRWGHPYPYWRYPKSSGTRIHHAYHLALFSKMTGKSFLEHSCFIEFGGGYGNMPRLLNRLGYCGKYLIYDFPEFAALQHFYLNGVGLNHGELDQWNAKECQQCSVSSWENLDEALKGVDLNQSLFMATWSLSEAPYQVRKPMLGRIKGVKSVLIAYQSHFEDLVNKEYFEIYQKENPEYDWYNVPIDHIPGHYYLFGVRKG